MTTSSHEVHQFSQEELDRIAREAEDRAREQLGHVRILVIGNTGAGKSTLINAIFGEDVAKVGQGRPVTDTFAEYRLSPPKDMYSIVDSRGVEVNDEKPIHDLVEYVRESQKAPSIKDRVHIAWLCIQEETRRIEEHHIQLAEEISSLGVPVLPIITKARMDKMPPDNSKFSDKVAELLSPPASKPVRVRAIAEEDDEGHIREPMGLEAVVAETERLLPEAVENAFVAAQVVDLKLKKKKALMIVSACAATAGAAGLAPTMGAGALAIVPIQIGMMSGINSVYGIGGSRGYVLERLPK